MEAAAFLSEPFLGQPTWAWLAFVAIVVALLVFDLGVLHRKQREIPVGESLLSRLATSLSPWPSAVGCGGSSGNRRDRLLHRLLIEKSLAWTTSSSSRMIFAYFAVPRELPAPGAVLRHPRRGGAARASMIGFGAPLVPNSSGSLYLFGGLPDLHRHQDVADGGDDEYDVQPAAAAALMRRNFRRHRRRSTAALLRAGPSIRSRPALAGS